MIAASVFCVTLPKFVGGLYYKLLITLKNSGLEGFWGSGVLERVKSSLLFFKFLSPAFI